MNCETEMEDVIMVVIHAIARIICRFSAIQSYVAYLQITFIASFDILSALEMKKVAQA